jgi:hypothetical protein
MGHRKTPVQQLSLVLADQQGLRWAQEQVMQHHCLRRPVDVHCRPLIELVSQSEPMNCLICGHPVAMCVNGYT